MSTLDSTQPPAARWVIEPARIGVWLFLATVTMLFAAFSSALIIRRAAADWAPLVLPPVLYLNTAVLLAASLALERAKTVERRRIVRWLAAAGALSVLFLLGQLAGWQALARMGIYLPTTPYGTFFYILTGLHGIHLLGGMAFLAYAAWRAAGKVGAWRAGSRATGLRQPASIHQAVSLCALYWHFLLALWIYLFVVLRLA